jgi:hypothetical protein
MRMKKRGKCFRVPSLRAPNQVEIRAIGRGAATFNLHVCLLPQACVAKRNTMQLYVEA